MHKDVVDNLWGAAVQHRIKILPEDASYEGNTSGSYRFTTPAHSDEDCPFKDGDYLKMDVYKVNE